MAKIKFGMMMTDARGKLGGQVFSKNRAGAFVRTKVTPSNPRTQPQMASRSILAQLSIGWNSLTEAQIASWNSAVESWQRTDIFGDLKKPSGKNLYVQLNKNLLQSGQPQIATAPEKDNVPDFSGLTLAIDTTAGTITYLGITPDPDIVLQFGFTPSLPQGVSFVKGKFRVIHYGNLAGTTPADLYNSYIARFGIPVAGANIHGQLKGIIATGQTTIPVNVKTTVS